ncbi:MAG: DUF4375 domain-containing protein [Acidobacteriota bacterium]
MSIREFIDRDAREPMDNAQFDDALWLALCERVSDPESLGALPHEVGVYYATRLVEWDVGNGGFAQATMNYPEWFDLAAAGFEELGKPAVASLIREAKALVSLEAENMAKAREGGLEGVFDYFKENAFDSLNERIEEVDFWSDDTRVAYVRQHRDAFRID